MGLIHIDQFLCVDKTSKPLPPGNRENAAFILPAPNQISVKGAGTRGDADADTAPKLRPASNTA